MASAGRNAKVVDNFCAHRHTEGHQFPCRTGPAFTSRLFIPTRRIGMDATYFWLASRYARRLYVASVLLLLSCGGTLAAEQPYFETQIRPIFREYCFDC